MRGLSVVSTSNEYGVRSGVFSSVEAALQWRHGIGLPQVKKTDFRIFHFYEGAQNYGGRRSQEDIHEHLQVAVRPAHLGVERETEYAGRAEWVHFHKTS